MEDLLISSTPASPALLEVSESAPPALPEALQSPTKPVSTGFSILLSAANAVLYLCLLGVGSLLLPLQVERMDPVNKVGILGIGLGLTALLPLVTNPIAGALSDRTASRFGRRRPWVFVGSIGCALALALMMAAGNVFMLFIGWGLLQITINLILTVLSALVPDQVPDKQRGTVSGMVGLAFPVGSIVGTILIGLVLKASPISYALMIPILLITLIPYSLFLRDKTLPRQHIASFDLWAFLKNFWVDPRKHPDFAWAGFTRFLTILGYVMGTGYLFYYLQDYVKFEQIFPGQKTAQGVSTLQITSTLVMILFILIGGILSDRFQRRKIFVVISCAIMAFSLLIYALFPFWTVILVASGLLGLGFGIHISVDHALVTQVLPSANNRAKDLGIINIAAVLPQSLAPAVAALFITQFHSYPILFIASALVTLLGGILIQPIKSVR